MGDVLRYLIATAAIGLLAGCGDTAPPQQAPPSHSSRSAGPTSLACAEFAPPPVAKPADMALTGRQCANPDGTTQWVNGFYQCTDGRIWPMLGATQQRPTEPVDPAFDKCIGRT